MSGATYFVTWRLRAGQADLTPDEKTAVFRAIEHFNGDRYELSAYVVMNDHVHVLFTPSGSHRVEDLIHSWKSFTANLLQRTTGRSGSVWQGEYFDRIVRDEDELLEKAKYIVGNPWKRWPNIAEYAWVGFKGSSEA